MKMMEEPQAIPEQFLSSAGWRYSSSLLSKKICINKACLLFHSLLP